MRLPALTGSVVLVPVKAFGEAKARLAPTLDAAGRDALARVMADTGPRRRRARCRWRWCATTPRWPRWAQGHGAMVLPEPGRGLNGAVEAGVERLGAAGASEVLVVHADLPFAQDVAQLAGFDGVTLVPDRRDDGTNVVCVPTGAGFRFHYGPGSFTRHAPRRSAWGCGAGWCATPSSPGTWTCPATSPPDWGRPFRADAGRRRRRGAPQGPSSVCL